MGNIYIFNQNLLMQQQYFIDVDRTTNDFSFLYLI